MTSTDAFVLVIWLLGGAQIVHGNTIIIDLSTVLDCANGIEAAVITLINGAIETVTKLIGDLKCLVNELLETVTQLIASVGFLLTFTDLANLSALGSTISIILSKLSDLLCQVIDALKCILATIAELIEDVIQKLTYSLKCLNTILERLTEDVLSCAENIVSAVQSILGNVSAALNACIDELNKAIENALCELESVLKTITSQISKAIAALLTCKTSVVYLLSYLPGILAGTVVAVVLNIPTVLAALTISIVDILNTADCELRACVKAALDAGLAALSDVENELNSCVDAIITT